MLYPTSLYFKVFGKVSGRLDPNALGIDFSALKTILQTIQDETKVEWKEIFDGFVVSGTFEQMKGIDNVLKNKFKERKGMKKVIPLRHFGESPAIGHSRSLPQSNPTESEKCPYFLPQNDQLEVNQSKKENSISCTSQADISATETGVSHGSYMNNNNSTGLHKRPSTTSENNQLGWIKGHKRADYDHSIEEIALNTNIADKTMSKTRHKLAGHPLHVPQAKMSGNGNKSSDKNIQDHGETKQQCEDKSLVQSPEMNKNESCNVIPQYNHPVPKKDESLGEDLQSTPKLFEKMKSDHNSSSMPPVLDRAHCEDNLLVQTSDNSLAQGPEMNKKESCNVIPQYHQPVTKKDESLGEELQSTPKLLEKMKSDHNSSSMPPALDKASSEGHIEIVETNKCVSEAEATANRKRRHENGILTESHWKFVTSTGVTVTLFVGNMSSQHSVDVFLCPANATLSYDEGLSKLIMDKGGQAIKDECLSITQSNNHLKEGATFITCAGNLPCKAVLHAVLPSWDDEIHDDKTTKLQIHKCLMDGLRLASGHRLKSIALPTLGQHWNKVPVEVSAEVIVRVVAAFGKNIGPMHSGITDFYIACEDGLTSDVFVEEFSSFSFKGQTPFFQSVCLTNDSGKKAKSQRTMAHKNKDKTGDSPIIKETVSVKQTQKEDTKARSGPLVSSPSALQQKKSPKHETGNKENQNGYPITSANLGKKLQENEKDTTTRCERRVCEKTLPFSTSSLIQRTEVSMVRPFEILEAKNAVKLSEENIKYVAVQEKLPPGTNTTTTLLQDKNLHVNEGEEVPGTCKPVEDTVADMTKDIAHNIQWQKTKDMSGQKEGNSDSQDTKIHNLKGIPREQIDRNSSPSNQNTLKSSCSGTNSGIFITSPTVDDLLNADLGLGIQGLEIFHGEEVGDHSHRSANLKAANEEGKGGKNVLEESPSSSAFPNTSQAFNDWLIVFDKTISKSRSISDKTEKEEFHESVRKDDVDETKKKDDGLAPGKNHNPEDKGNGNVSLESLIESIKGILKAYQFKNKSIHN